MKTFWLLQKAHVAEAYCGKMQAKQISFGKNLKLSVAENQPNSVFKYKKCVVLESRELVTIK